MKSLSANWFIRYPIDFEYSKWILLDYLNYVHDNFKSRKLFPHLNDLKLHISNLNTWINKRELLKTELKGINFEDLTLIYDIPENSPDIIGISEIIEYSKEKMNSLFKSGRIIWQNIEKELQWGIVGVVPNYKAEGYILVKNNKEVRILNYKLNQIIVDDVVSISEIGTEEWGTGGYSKIKSDLIKSRDLPFPFTISIEVPNLPYEETILPMIKQIALVKINNI